MMNFENKIAVITGGASGLGRALAVELYKQGCHLALIDLDITELEKLKNELERAGQKLTIHQADVASEEDIIAARAAILTHHPHIDILVNNAAVSISRNFEQTDLPDFRRLFDVNFWGTVYATKYFLPDLKLRDDSRLVNVISDFAFMGFPGKSAYASSKSAVWGFSNVLKTELSATSVKICFVVPPPLDTGLVKNSKHMSDEKKAKEAAFVKKHGLPLTATAKRIVVQVRKGKYRIIIGKMMFGLDVAARLFPTLLHGLIGKNKNRIDFV